MVPTLARLGPEPLSDDFTLDGFAADLAATRSPVKVALLNQRLVAGVGNIYADEALWRARINPHARRVGRDRAARLHRAVRDVLAEAIQPRGHHLPGLPDGERPVGSQRRLPAGLRTGRAALPALRDPDVHVVLGGRGTTYCRTCQT